MTPHCHAPSCIREEIWNDDTGEIICNVTAMYGESEYGDTTAIFNEVGLVNLILNLNPQWLYSNPVVCLTRRIILRYRLAYLGISQVLAPLIYQTPSPSPNQISNPGVGSTGLQTPWQINPDTNITAIKYFNNTYRHLGQMAQWTGMMVYDTDPY